MQILSEIKKRLLENPEKIVDILEHYGYCNISLKKSYIHFGRSDDKESSKKSIVIYLTKNDWLNVKDHPKNICTDLFSYIMSQKKVEFIDIFTIAKNLLGIVSYDFFEETTISAFGGFYSNIKKRKNEELKIYDSSILNSYNRNGNIRFLNDKIALSSQKYFNICYDTESQGIVIPIYNQFGDIIGIKIRCNWDVEDGNQKYYYIVPCKMSHTLYGYSQNYQYLTGNIIYVFESEKSVMQAHSYGIRNCIAIGNSSVSSTQAKMMMELQPKKIILMHDEGLDINVIESNIKLLKIYTKMFDVDIGYWDSTKDISIPHKSSPTDLGLEKLQQIIEEQIIII